MTGCYNCINHGSRLINIKSFFRKRKRRTTNYCEVTNKLLRISKTKYSEPTGAYPNMEDCKDFVEKTCKTCGEYPNCRIASECKGHEYYLAHWWSPKVK